MSPRKVLVVEDEPDIEELIRYHLERERFQVLSARSGEEGIEIASKERPDLILLDLMLPGMDGLEACRLLRGDPRTARIPIIMLTARTEEADVVTGLEMGADDYMTKPFRPRVLLARVRAVQRRLESEKAPPVEERIELHGLRIDFPRHEVHLEGRPVSLTLTEFKILVHLARNRGRVFSRYQILDSVQGRDAFVLERTIDVHLAALRRKLGRFGERIETVRGVGYRLRDA